MDAIGRQLAAIDELETASDRAFAILAAAVVESQLTDVLRKHLHRDDTEYSKKVRGQLFHPDGPLGTFGAKIGMAYVLDYLTPAAHTDLQNLKNIRNLFAHYAEHNAFGTQKIEALCSNFTLVHCHLREQVVIQPVDEPGKLSLSTDAVIVDGQGRLWIATEHLERNQTTPRGRFTGTAQLFVAGFGIALEPDGEVRKPIL